MLKCPPEKSILKYFDFADEKTMKLRKLPMVPRLLSGGTGI